MKSLPRFLTACLGENTQFEISDFKEFLKDGRIEMHLRRKEGCPKYCHKCKSELGAERGKYPLRLEGMPIGGLPFFIHLWRIKGECPKCKKARAEHISLIAEETPHLTQDYAWWIGRICEIAAISRVAELINQDETTTWRLDLNRMQWMMERYKIPPVTRISVDEVYSRKKPKFKGESRNQRFFTVITDLDTHKVIWVTEGRDEASLDAFFTIIGKAACENIIVVAADMHDAFARSVKKNCPNANLVWDRFHVMQSFEKALNAQRMLLHEAFRKNSKNSELTRGKYRFLFLKKDSRRTEDERKHINDVVKDNEQFVKLELIKERMITFFDQPDILQGRLAFHDVGGWIMEAGFTELRKWYDNLNSQWDQLANYFKHRVTSALSEGINNVIKSLRCGSAKMYPFCSLKMYQGVRKKIPTANSHHDCSQWVDETIQIRL